MPLPNFLVIGASKSGTTSLYNYLKQHPQIFMSSVKEANYFAVLDTELSLSGPGDQKWYEESIADLDSYKSLFKKVTSETAVGEASPTYLHSETAPQNISLVIPEAKLIAILRDPVERAYSHYLFFKRVGLEEANTFEEALELEKDRLEKGWFWPKYKFAGMYGRQINRYLEYFGEEQLKLIKFEDFKSETEKSLKSIFEFLDVDPTFQPTFGARHNASGVPQNKLIDSIFSIPTSVKKVIRPFIPDTAYEKLLKVKNNNLKKPEMKESTRRYLRDYFREDITKLENLTNLKLGNWK